MRYIQDELLEMANKYDGEISALLRTAALKITMLETAIKDVVHSIEANDTNMITNSLTKLKYMGI